jgi:hypothetical protein
MPSKPSSANSFLHASGIVLSLRSTGMTLTQVGREIGLSKPRTLAIQQEALAKVRSLRGHPLVIVLSRNGAFHAFLFQGDATPSCGGGSA